MKISTLRIAAALLTTSAFSQAAPPPRYYPGPDAPLTANPLLAGIESAFAPSVPQATLRFPLPETGARLALADEFFTAYKTALAADPANAAGIVRAARRVVRVSDGSRKNRPLPLDTSELIAAAGEVPAVVPHLGEILDALLDEEPAETVVIATGAISTAARGGATAAELRNMAHAAAMALVNGFKIADAPYVELTRSILAGTVTTDLTGSDHMSVSSAILQGLIRGIRDRGFEKALIDDVARGASRSLPFVSDVTIGDFATSVFTEAATDRHQAILIAAAFVAGTPFFYLQDNTVANEVVAAGTAAAPAFTAEISAAATHSLTVRLLPVSTDPTDPNQNFAGKETLKRIVSDGVNLSDALVCAALMSTNRFEYYNVLRAGFDGSYGIGITPPATPFLEWLRIALSGNPTFAPGALGQAIDRANAEGLFVGGITPGTVAGAVLTAGAPLSLAPATVAVTVWVPAAENSTVWVVASTTSAASVGTLMTGVPGTGLPKPSTAVTL